MAETQVQAPVQSEPTPAADPAYNPAQPETRQTPIDNPPSGKKEDTISVTYRPAPGDPQRTETYDRKFKAGEAQDIPVKFADKARGNPYFSVAGETTVGDEQPEQVEDDEQDDATFEDNLARERSKEYLQGRTYLASPPGEAERVARAQEQARELQESVNDPETDKPRRGRPPKAK